MRRCVEVEGAYFKSMWNGKSHEVRLLFHGHTVYSLHMNYIAFSISNVLPPDSHLSTSDKENNHIHTFEGVRRLCSTVFEILGSGPS